jgi:hypothetical protein
MTSSDYRRLLPALFALAVVALPAHAQSPVSRVCVQLEAQLAAFDRGAADPARAEQIRRFEDAAHKQQFELDRVTANARRTGCEGTGFFLFGGQPAQCGPINTQIQQMRANLARIQSDLAQLEGGSGPDREAQRAAVLASLAENDCGPQYRTAAAPRRGGLFEALFGPSNIFTAPAESTQSGTYRTVCVRTCDGYFYPISFSTVPGRFRDDERVCQRSCPAAEVALYSHRNPGEDMNQAVSLNTQQPYTALPTAFRYRQSFDAACSCRRAGETWAQALKHLDDQTVERGDIVVNEQRARQMSQPRLDAQGKPIRPEPRSTPAPPVGPAATTPPAREATAEPNPKRSVRAVGPTFLPAR